MKTSTPALLPPALKSLVNNAVRLFGEVLRDEVGASLYYQIETLRENMAALRGSSTEEAYRILQTKYRSLERLSPEKRLIIARAFTLMLEVMNACENSYRTSRLHLPPEVHEPHKQLPVDQVTYVLTAHPTEARAPENIAIFHQIQCLLTLVLEENPGNPMPIWTLQKQTDLKHLLAIAWRTWIVRHRSPKVKDEAEHIYSMLFRGEVFEELLEMLSEKIPLRLLTWVGGDKDGHPGVQERTLLESLTLSRAHLVGLALQQLQEIRAILTLFQKGSTSSKRQWQKKIASLEKEFRRLRKILPGDGGRVLAIKKRLADFTTFYCTHVGEKHPGLRRLEQITTIFPGFVVPLELRESSDVLMSDSNKPLAIDRMLARVARISRGGEPRWYAHGFIISMCQSMEHIQKAASKQQAAFNRLALPIIPLFEDVTSLKKSPSIVQEMVTDRHFKSAAKKYWNHRVEIMVGYSDSSKEAGVLFSRLSIAEALPVLEKVCLRAKLTPVFFHGSGGSVDRGGGSIQDQTAWWPRSALKNYKVTIQGEMVERSFATAEIARGQIETIVRSAEEGMKKKTVSSKSAALDAFAHTVQQCYSAQIKSPEFLRLVEKATPYSFLRLLKMGSRPSKRAQQLQVSGLRAIPWILCWTQTRVLFPIWWGVGTAWSKATPAQKRELQKDFRLRPVFTSYVKALGFTLAKTELAVWRIYLEKSSLHEEEAQQAYRMFEAEWKKTQRFFRELSGEKNFTWEKPWLGESILLRSPMIHPLNLLQILAQKTHDVELLRVTATGISSGMLTTG